MSDETETLPVRPPPDADVPETEVVIWIGLHDAADHEIAAPGYRRADVNCMPMVGLDRSGPRPHFFIVFAEAIQFPKAESDWGEVRSFAFYDHPWQGEPFLRGVMPNPVNIPEGRRVHFAAGMLRVMFNQTTAPAIPGSGPA
jgi:hypothetical protein